MRYHFALVSKIRKWFKMCDVHANRQIVKSSIRNLNAIFGISVLLLSTILMHVYDTMPVASARKYVANRKLMQHHTESLNHMVFCRQWFAMQCFLFSMSHRHISHHKSMAKPDYPSYRIQTTSSTLCSTVIGLHTYRCPTTKHIKINTNKKVRHTPYYRY